MKESRINLVEEKESSRKDRKKNENSEEPALEMLRARHDWLLCGFGRQSRRCAIKREESKRVALMIGDEKKQS